MAGSVARRLLGGEHHPAVTHQRCPQRQRRWPVSQDDPVLEHVLAESPRSGGCLEYDAEQSDGGDEGLGEEVGEPGGGHRASRCPLDQLRTGALAADDLDPDAVPVLLAMSDNGPRMRSHSTREFMAACAIMQRFGRPSTPTDQAWIESLFGHVKGEWPQLEKIRDPGELVVELDRVRVEYNTVRLHAGIDYVTPDDEHHGRGDGIRQARRDGLARARTERINYRRTKQENNQ